MESYSRFRACVEHTGRSFHGWIDGKGPESLPDDDPRIHYHAYVQWIAHEQLQALSDRARQGGGGLYLDMPLGVAGDGYDVWAHGNVFAKGASGDAQFACPSHEFRPRPERRQIFRERLGSRIPVLRLRIDRAQDDAREFR